MRSPAVVPATTPQPPTTPTQQQHKSKNSFQMSTSAVMTSEELELKANQEKAKALFEDLRDVNKKIAQQEAIKKAKAKIDDKRTYENNRLAHKEQKPNAMIKPCLVFARLIGIVICCTVLVGKENSPRAASLAS
ncbi:hypothetical protein PTTG_04326, partial [Puccinia triticina 1-1 BBBD Race 1]